MGRLLHGTIELLLGAAVVLAVCGGAKVINRAMLPASPDQMLIGAAGSRDPAELDRALACGGSPAARDPQGTTPLMCAALIGNDESLRKLLDRGADVNAADDYGATALFYAARGNQVSAVVELLRHGADPLRRNQGGSTALEIAGNLGSFEAAGALRSREGRVP